MIDRLIDLGRTCSIWRFPGEGSYRSCSCRPAPQPQHYRILPRLSEARDLTCILTDTLFVSYRAEPQRGSAQSSTSQFAKSLLPCKTTQFPGIRICGGGTLCSLPRCPQIILFYGLGVRKSAALEVWHCRKGLWGAGSPQGRGDCIVMQVRSVCVCARMFICACAHLYVRVHVCVYARLCVCVCVHVYMTACMFICASDEVVCKGQVWGCLCGCPPLGGGTWKLSRWDIRPQ